MAITPIVLVAEKSSNKNPRQRRQEKQRQRQKKIIKKLKPAQKKTQQQYIETLYKPYCNNNNTGANIIRL